MLSRSVLARSRNSRQFVARRSEPETLENRLLLATITVDTLADELDGSIVDGDVSLRDAITNAAANDTINFSVNGRLELTLGELVVSQNLTISGPGAELLTISGNDSSRVFRINGGTVHLAHLEIADGRAQGGDGGDSEFGGGGGGGNGMGGAIFVNTGGAVIAQNLLFDSNEAIGGDGGSSGVPGAGNSGGTGGASSLGEAGASGGSGTSSGGNAANFGAGGGGGAGSNVALANSGAGGNGNYGGGGGGGGGGGLNATSNAYLSSVGGNNDQGSLLPSIFGVDGIGEGRDGHDGLDTNDSSSSNDFNPSVPPGTGGGGAGGAGLGGAIFVRSGGTLSVVDSRFTKNRATGGTFGRRGESPGLGKGAAIYAMSGVNVNAVGISFGEGSETSNIQSTTMTFPSNPTTATFSFGSEINTADVFGRFSNSLPGASLIDGPSTPSIQSQSWLNGEVRNHRISFEPETTTVSEIAGRIGRTGLRQEEASPQGIAITAVDDANGLWQYDAGAGFQTVSSVPTFLLTQDNGSGSLELRLAFQAIEAGAESAGYQLAIIDSGGTNSVSLEGAILTFRVNIGAGFSAQDAIDLLAADVTLASKFRILLLNDADNDGTTTLNSQSAVSFDVASIASDSNALRLNSTSEIRFLPRIEFDTVSTANPLMTVREWDETGGATGTFADTTTNGGGTAFTTATASVRAVIYDPLIVVSGNPFHFGGNGTILTYQQDTLFPLVVPHAGFPHSGNAGLDSTIIGVGGVWAGGPTVSSARVVVESKDEDNANFDFTTNRIYTGVMQFGALSSNTTDGQSDQMIHNSNIHVGHYTVKNTASEPLALVRDLTAIQAGVTHFKVTNLSDGRLFSDASLTTPVDDGDFISYGNGNVYLYYLPAIDFTGNASFSIQQSTSTSDAGLTGSLRSQNIEVFDATDAPSTTFTALRSGAAERFSTAADISWDIQFSDAVTGVDAADFLLNFSPSSGVSLTDAGDADPSTYVLTAFSVPEGTLEIDQLAGLSGITDSTGVTTIHQRSGERKAHHFKVDRTSATPVISSTESPGPTSLTDIPISVDFGEKKIQDFVIDDIVVTNGTVSGFTRLNNGQTYDFIVTPNVNGTVTVDIAAGAGADKAGNQTIAAAQFSITSERLEAAFTRVGTLSTTDASVAFNVNFSAEAVNVDASDFVVTTTGSTRADAVVSVSDAGDADASTYIVTVTNVSGHGTLALDFAADTDIDNGSDVDLVFTPTSDERYQIVDDIHQLLTVNGRVPGNVTVSVSGDDLLIVPGSNDNAISVSTTASGDVVVTGLGGTTVNGLAEFVAFTNVAGVVPGDLRISGTAGRDLISVSSLTIDGKLKIDGGSDVDAIAVHDVISRSVLKVDEGGGDGFIDITDTTVTGRGKIFGRAGHNEITVTGSSFLDLLRLTTDSGDDTISFDTVAVNASMEINTGAGRDSVSVTGVNASGAATFDVGAGNDILDFFEFHAFSSTTVNTGADNDHVRFLESRLDRTARLNLSAGHHIVDLQTTTFHGEAIVDASSAVLGVRIRNNTFLGDARIIGGSGNNDAILDDESNTRSSLFEAPGFERFSIQHIDALFEDLGALLFD